MILWSIFVAYLSELRRGKCARFCVNKYFRDESERFTFWLIKWIQLSKLFMILANSPLESNESEKLDPPPAPFKPTSACKIKDSEVRGISLRRGRTRWWTHAEDARSFQPVTFDSLATLLILTASLFASSKYASFSESYVAKKRWKASHKIV